MRTNYLDDYFPFENKKKIIFPLVLKIIFIVFIIFILFFSISLFLSIGNDNTYEIDTNGEKYGKSQFIKYQGKIYVPVPSGGMYVLENVDIDTFKPLNSEDYYSRIIGLDKNRVYFGNIPIPDLNPNTFYSIGNGYYTDRTNTYFCSSFSERNKDLSALMEVLQMSVYSTSKNKKPQSYIYPYKKIETNKKLVAVEKLLFFATDGEKVYYKGEVLENADLSTLKNIGDHEYFADKENVYYKTKLLPIKNSGKLKIVSAEQGYAFLYDEKNGYVFIEDYSFDREKAPYKVIGKGGSHLYNLVFVAKDGVYYYDSEKKKQLKAEDNIFVGNIEEITPNIFSDDENIYYFSAYEVWQKLRGGGRTLFSRNTEIYYLDKKDGWEKVGDVRGGIIGSIWKKGNRYYYFDNSGIHQLIYNTIYEISDVATLEYLMNTDDVNSDKIRKLIENKNLIAILGEKKFEITIKYKSIFLSIGNFFKIIFYFIVIVTPIFRIFKKYIINKKFRN